MLKTDQESKELRDSHLFAEQIHWRYGKKTQAIQFGLSEARRVMKVVSVAGARPNFMKIAPFLRELKKVQGIQHLLVHSGQHYDDKLSAVFFRDLNLPKPDVDLQVGSGSHAWQTAEVMKRLEPLILEYKADLVVVVGDVNTTLAAALTSAKLGIPLAHIEAGLRSFDKSMPEEINRKLTDAVADFLFVSEKSGLDNLRNEGIPTERIFFVGNVMIDSLLEHRALASQAKILQELGLREEGGVTLPYAVLTLHRPASVDKPDVLGEVLGAVRTIARELPVLFPVHPRTKTRIEKFGLGHLFSTNQTQRAKPGLYPLPPLAYLEFLCLMDHARLLLTDSGGIQEETTVLGVPCLTLRENTERPATIAEGTNQLVGLSPNRIISAASRVLSGHCTKGQIPQLWDGKAAHRIVSVLLKHFDIPSTRSEKV